MFLPSLVTLFLCTGCTDKKNQEEQTEELLDPVPLEAEPLSTLALSRRISLDLRAQYPTEAELNSIESNPDALWELVDSWMTEEAHTQQLLSLFAALLLTRVDEFNVDYQDYHLDVSQEFPFAKSVGEEPLRLMTYVTTQDAPWTDIITVDYTMANQLLLDLWPLEPVGASPTGDEWVLARYTDGRPAGGIIMSNGLWWRHYTTPNNKSRSRASFLTKLLVCDDHLAREVDFQPEGLSDEDDIELLVATDPSCIACHTTLDPVAAALYGFWQHDIHDVVELDHYHPERERLGELELATPMAWYGKPLDAPADLGPTTAGLLSPSLLRARPNSERKFHFGQNSQKNMRHYLAEIHENRYFHNNSCILHENPSKSLLQICN